jgi:hypothetical protein
MKAIDRPGYLSICFAALEQLSVSDEKNFPRDIFINIHAVNSNSNGAPVPSLLKKNPSPLIICPVGTHEDNT